MIMLQCTQEEDKIYSTDIYGQRILVGRTESAFKQVSETAEKAVAKAEEYLDELIKHGIRQKPKSQEEINMDLQKQMQEILSELKSLKKSGGKKNEHPELEIVSN